MKAMLYADWMNLRRSMKAIMIAIIVIALVSIVSGKGLSFVPAMLCMLSLMVPATLMSSDYAYGWDKLSLSLPVSRRDVVSSKFAISLLVNLTVAALGMICIWSGARTVFPHCRSVGADHRADRRQKASGIQ